MKRTIPAIFAVFSMLVLSFGQSQQVEFGRVSVLGEDEARLTELSNENPQMLLSVFGNDMDLAYEKWMAMLGAMEDYSDEIEYDIKGLKTYLRIFWRPDGTIAHLAFFPKANSRNIPIAELRAFFKGFAREYRMQVTTEIGFSHYATASFPLHSRPEYNASKN